MRGQVLLMGVMLIATPLTGATTASAAPTPSSFDPATITISRILLQCDGSMSTTDREPDGNSPIIANGTIDLGAGRVTGFGIGAANIVTATPELIAFGDSPDAGVNQRARTVSMPKGGGHAGPQVLGSFNRTTGETRILVHGAGDPSQVIIAMDLRCRMSPAPVAE